MAKRQFKAESKRLLDLMVNSIYTHKEIFLREIISNASDACDKLCYQALTDDAVGMSRKDFKIEIKVDKEHRTLTVSDNGIGMDKEEIVQIARKIGTFETSILPYEDCCTVFTPRHPRLRPMPGEVEAAEQTLDIDAMVKAAVDGIERVQVNL